MGLNDSMRRWMNDRRTQDEYIDGTPRSKIRDLAAVLPHIGPDERQSRLEHLRGYINYYYLGHQREAVPMYIGRAFNRMDREATRLSAVDQARAVLQKYGGPPTRLTLEESLERSATQRSKEFAQMKAGPAVQREMSWTDLHPKQEAAQVQNVEQAHGQKQEQKQKRSQGQGMEISA